MDVDEYLKILETLEPEYADNLPSPYWSVAREWFWDTAPTKTEEYGTEAWMRMGSLGILAELSGCHYRCRRFIERGRRMIAAGLEDLSVYNAVLDYFGYSVMLRVCVGIELPDMDVPFDWALATAHSNPIEDNELLLRSYWDDRQPIGSLGPPVALRSALNSWRLLW